MGMDEIQMECQNEDEMPKSIYFCDQQLFYSRPLQNHNQNSTHISDILRKDVKVRVERVNCLLSEDSVNVTCDRCSGHFTSLSRLIQHLKSATNTTTNNNNKNNYNKQKKPRTSILRRGRQNYHFDESVSLVSHSACEDSDENNMNLPEPTDENELEQNDHQVPENASSPRTTNKKSKKGNSNSSPLLLSNDDDVESNGKSFNLELAPSPSRQQKSKKELEIQPGEIICEFCGMELKSMNRLRKHLVCHSNEFPFVCTEPNCSKAFKRKFGLAQHKLIHTTDFSFLCTECGARFYTNARLRVHMFSHSEKIHKCDECDFSTAFKQSLKSHVKAKHEQETFSCSLCEKVFKHKTTLRYHEISHSVKGIVKCTEEGCNYETGHPANLHKHRKHHHNGSENKRKKGRKKAHEHLQQNVEEQGNFEGQSSNPDVDNSTANNNENNDNNYDMNAFDQNVEIIVHVETHPEQPQFQLCS